MINKTLILALISLFSYAHAGSKCPNSSVVEVGAPCSFLQDLDGCDFECNGDTTFDIQAIFANVNEKLDENEKQFRNFYLDNTAIEKLPLEMFSGINFTRIFIARAYSLRRIHPDAFYWTGNSVQEFSLKDAPISADRSADSDLWAALGRLTSVTNISITNTSITKLPYKAISDLWHLKEAYFHDNPIESVETLAFNNLHRLELIQIHNSPLARVEKMAFTVGYGIGHHMDLVLTISLVLDGLTGASFAPGAFDYIERTTSLFMNYNNLTYLDQHVFDSFLTQSGRNTIFMGSKMQCKDSRNQWIHEKYSYVWMKLNCGSN